MAFLFQCFETYLCNVNQPLLTPGMRYLSFCQNIVTFYKLLAPKSSWERFGFFRLTNLTWHATCIITVTHKVDTPRHSLASHSWILHKNGSPTDYYLFQLNRCQSHHCSSFLCLAFHLTLFFCLLSLETKEVDVISYIWILIIILTFDSNASDPEKLEKFLKLFCISCKWFL